MNVFSPQPFCVCHTALLRSRIAGALGMRLWIPWVVGDEHARDTSDVEKKSTNRGVQRLIDIHV